MADQGGGSAAAAIESSFPLPPEEYASRYTDEQISRRLAPAPPAPIDGHYASFGEPLNTHLDILQSLESQGIRQLYSANADRRHELKRLTRSLVAAFLDLLEILIRNPGSEDRNKKLEDLRLLFFNTHHLINEYRPHQARETLHLMMEIQKRERIQTAARFHQQFENAAESLRLCLANLPSSEELTPLAELIAEVEAVLRGEKKEGAQKLDKDTLESVDPSDLHMSNLVEEQSTTPDY